MLEHYDFENPQINAQTDSLRATLQKEVVGEKDFEHFGNIFILHFQKYAKKYGKILSREDHRFILKLIESSKKKPSSL